jgi:hypothetical protein
MSEDGVVPPQSGPSRRPAGGPANQPGAETAQGPAARRYETQERGETHEGAADRAESGSRGRGVPGASARAASAVPVSAAPVSTTAAAADLGLGLDLATALRTRVAVVGRSGPPPGSLARIRRKAHARQRNRAVLAGSAGILVLAIGVTLATGDRFDLVPKLTSAVGLGGGSGTGSQGGSGGTDHASTAASGGHVVWPSGSTGKDGLAIGPVAPITGTPSAVAASRVPLCTAASLKTSTTVGPTVGGVVYGRVDAVATAPCVVVGPPVLTVANQTGTAASSVSILKADLTAAPQLPAVPTWGTTMVLTTGEGYEFQFAWAAAGCAQTSASPTTTQAAGTSSSTYYLGYAVTGTTPTTAVTLKAACSAQLFVTDLYQTGAFPLPKAPTTPPASSPSTTAATSSSPSTSTSTAPPDSPSASPSASAAAPNGVSSGDTTPSG